MTKQHGTPRPPAPPRPEMTCGFGEFWRQEGYDQAVADAARRESYPADECTACFEAHAPLTPTTVAGVTVYLCPGCEADTRRRSTPPCPCECNAGGFCGGCAHAGCGGRR